MALRSNIQSRDLLVLLQLVPQGSFTFMHQNKVSEFMLQGVSSGDGRTGLDVKIIQVYKLVLKLLLF